jgi:integrase
MARQLHQLSARAIETLATTGRHSDGGGLYLFLSEDGRRRWIFMYTRNGKRTEIGLGAAGKHAVTLAEARTRAAECRAMLDRGIDPKAERERRQAEEAATARSVVTFGAFADDLIDSIKAGFRNAKHEYQWRQTLGDSYCAEIRNKPVDQIGTEDVLRVLRPHWSDKQETASRLRGRIERVLDAAKAKGLRTGENPARWRGHLDTLLSKRQKLKRGHQPAMPFDQVPAFVSRLRGRNATSALALEFLILTAARSGEVCGATWAEIDLKAGIWTVPAARMKAGKEHRVPLTRRADEILRLVLALNVDNDPAAFVFPGGRAGRPLSNMAFSQLLERMGETGFVPHGFRSSFRDWAGECTPYPREVAEAALAHLVGDSVERAYRRGDALEKRRGLMRDWAAFIEGKPAENVVALREAI